jgi:signal transduction histidine kinase
MLGETECTDGIRTKADLGARPEANHGNGPMIELLMLEDNSGDALLTGRLLPREDFSLTQVDRLSAGLEALAKKHYDLVIVDLGLPDSDGVATVERLAFKYPELPIIVLTGLADENIAEHALQAGAQDYLVKGEFTSGEAVKAIRYAMVRKQVDVQKSRFLGLVSHELRSPLTAVTGYAELLEDELEGPLTERQREFVEQIGINTGRVLQLVEDLLDVARMDAGMFALTFAEADVAQVANEVAQAVLPLFMAEHLNLSIEIAQSPLLACIDARRVGQVISNLLDNAIKYTSPGGLVRLSVKPIGTDIQVAVLDTGPGVTAAGRERLFTQFGQLPTPAMRGKQGTGLGLWLSKAIVEGHGGRIDVESEAGQGAKFWFTLPTDLPPPGAVDNTGTARRTAH